eukprot:g3862.t1
MTCDICYKRFTVDGEHVPKLLPCGHSYCSKCLASITNNSTTIACPNCRIRFDITNSNTLPKNFKLIEVIEEEKQKVKLRKQQQGTNDNEQWRAFERLAIEFCSYSQKLLEVLGELAEEPQKMITSKEIENLKSLSLKLNDWKASTGPNGKAEVTGKAERTLTKQQRSRRMSQSSAVQARQRWRY